MARSRRNWSLPADPADLVDVCKSNYYAGEVSLLHGHIDDAIAYFRSSVNTGLVMQPNSTAGDPMNEVAPRPAGGRRN